MLSIRNHHLEYSISRQTQSLRDEKKRDKPDKSYFFVASIKLNPFADCETKTRIDYQATWQKKRPVFQRKKTWWIPCERGTCGEFGDHRGFFQPVVAWKNGRESGGKHGLFRMVEYGWLMFFDVDSMGWWLAFFIDVWLNQVQWSIDGIRWVHHEL